MKFTDLTVKALKPCTNRYEVYETGSKGFGIRVTPSGTKTFVYRYKVSGRPRRMTLGTYPDIRLKNARKQLDVARAKLATGLDPAAETLDSRRAELEAVTVEELAREYLERWAKNKKRTWKEDARILNKDVLPAWARRKAKNMRRRDVVELLDNIIERGSPISANRTFEIVRRMFRFGVERDLIEHSPCFGVRKPAPERIKDRVLSPAELSALWSAIDHLQSYCQIWCLGG
ncbi:MAG: integrase family protein [Gammaproteobacteria bacterium]